MKSNLTIVTCLVCLLTICGATSPAFASALNGQADNMIDSLGYYYMLTGSQFPNGQTVNGNNASGGTLRYLTDDPTDSYTDGEWVRDDWYDENSGMALTMKNDGTIVYDNNLIENGDPYGPDNFYNDELNTNDEPIAGLVGGWCMSNNYDWIYAGYFKLTEETEVDTVIGYFDARSGFDPFNPAIGYRVNIWSSVVDGNYLMPTFTNSFDGDILCSDDTAGTISVSDTGVKRHYSGWGAGVDDIIWRVQFELAEPITLQPGEYFFSHDATITPEPASFAVWGLLAVIGMAVTGWRRR